MRRRVRESCSIAVSREVAFAALVDAERLPEWLAGVTGVRVLDREGDVAVIEVRAPLYRAEGVVLELIQSAPREIRFQEVGGYGRPKIAGRCALADGDGGARVEVTLRVAGPLVWIGGRRRLRRGVEEALAALAERAVEIDAGRVAPAAGRREILEILEHRDGLEIVLRGLRYRLVRADAAGGSR